jgi:hypothetical protein
MYIDIRRVCARRVCWVWEERPLNEKVPPMIRGWGVAVSIITLSITNKPWKRKLTIPFV